MPRLSGVEVIRSIRASGSRVPILVLTGSGQDLIAPAIRAGANEVLVKPVEIDGMLSALHRYL
jgi:CheY-like chemotaxis protein